MVLNDIKVYLLTRINTSEILEETDQELNKYMVTAYNLLNTFYVLDNVSDEALVKIIGEEMIFLFNSNIDLNLFYQYEGLTSFKVGDNAIQGTVDYKNKGALFSDYVKGILASLGIEERIELPETKVKTGFTWS